MTSDATTSSRGGTAGSGTGWSVATIGRRGSVRLKIAMFVAIAGAATAIGYAALRGGDEQELSDSGARTSDRAVVKKTSFEITTKCSGELEARNQIEVRSKLESQSTIVELVAEGKSVKAGDLLVRLNSDKIEQDILEQTLQVESARAELVAAENGYNIQLSENESKTRQSVSKVKLAQLALEQWEKGDLAKKRLELDLAKQKGTRDLERLDKKVKNSRILQAKGFLSQNELDLDEIDFVEAKAAVDKAVQEQTTYENYKLPQERETFSSALIEANAELKRVEMNNEIELASKEAARTNRRKQLAVREEKLKNLETQLANATVRAPSDGLVVHATSMSSGRGFGGDRDGPLQIGRQVFPNELLMILPDTSDMMASVRVQESLAGRIRRGQSVTVQVDAAGGKMFAGQVESTSVLAETGGWRDPNLREYTVKVALNQADLEGAGLKPSMRVDSTITLGQVEDVVAVPVQAVFNEGQVRFVYLQRGSKFVKAPIKMGRRSDTFAEIAVGVGEGEVVLVREPTAGEVFVQPWDKAQLELAGYSVGEDGQPVVVGQGGGGAGKQQDGSGGGPRSARGKGRGDPTATPGPATASVPRGGENAEPKSADGKSQAPATGLADASPEKAGEIKREAAQEGDGEAPSEPAKAAPAADAAVPASQKSHE